MTWLREAARITLQSAGSKTPGIDGVTRNTFQQCLHDELTLVREQLLAGTYEPAPVRRVYIPKSNGKKRPLGIPTLRDRVVQRAMLMAMDPIWESDFHDKSYGFRPVRGVHNAIGTLRMQMTNQVHRGYWVIEGDLSSYFDTVHHRLLMQVVRKRVRDKRLLNLLWKFIKAGHIDKGLFRASSEGVPQGGVISPLLSNIMLHEFDMWLEENYIGLKILERTRNWNWSVKSQAPVAIREGRERRPRYSYCRYADDFVIVVGGTHEHAREFREICRQFLEGRLRLKLNMEKTHITHVNDGFDFLGHRIMRKRNGKGDMTVVTMIPWKKYRSFAESILELFEITCSEPDELIERLNHKLKGWANFYRYTHHTATIYRKIDQVVFWKFAKWLTKKYRVHVPEMMAKHFKRPSKLEAKTWSWPNMNIKARGKNIYLYRLIGSKKVKATRPLLKVNPYTLDTEVLKEKHSYVSAYKETAYAMRD